MIGSREFRLLVDCCGSAFAEKARDRLAPPPEIDWALFLRLAHFHRVEGLAWNALAANQSLPQFAREQLSAEATAIASSNLRIAAECRRIAGLFADAELDLLFVKGLTLAVLAYGTIATKTGVDVDLLVAPHALQKAAMLLRRGGYGLDEAGPAASTERLAQWHRLRKETAWSHESGSLQIDLHTRLADNPRLIPTIGLGSRRQLIEVAQGIALPTLAREELFAYLAVHGASSAWFRLKWITDFAALIHHRGSAELEQLYDRSQELGAGRAPAQALLLADRLYGSLDRAPMLKERLSRDRAARWLAATALRQVAGRAEPVEPTARFLGTAAIHYSQFLLLPHLGFKFSELWRQGRAALL